MHLKMRAFGRDGNPLESGGAAYWAKNQRKVSTMAGSGEYGARERELLAGMERVLAMANATVLKKGDI